MYGLKLPLPAFRAGKCKIVPSFLSEGFMASYNLLPWTLLSGEHERDAMKAVRKDCQSWEHISLTSPLGLEQRRSFIIYSEVSRKRISRQTFSCKLVGFKVSAGLGKTGQRVTFSSAKGWWGSEHDMELACGLQILCRFPNLFYYQDLKLHYTEPRGIWTSLSKPADFDGNYSKFT